MKKKSWFFGFVIVAILLTCAIFYFRHSILTQKNEPKLLVQSYLQELSQGQFAKAGDHLIGEAALRFSQANHPKRDPLTKVDVITELQSDGFAKVEATIQSSNDALVEDFYLQKKGTEWKIFSFELKQNIWEDLKTPSLSDDQKRTIQNYTAAVAAADKAKQESYLAGPALMATATDPRNNPREHLSIVSITGVGHTQNGLLAKVVENSDTAGQISVLYTLVQVGNQWKIYDHSITDLR